MGDPQTSKDSLCHAGYSSRLLSEMEAGLSEWESSGTARLSTRGFHFSPFLVDSACLGSYSRRLQVLPCPECEGHPPAVHDRAGSGGLTDSQTHLASPLSQQLRLVTTTCASHLCATQGLVLPDRPHPAVSSQSI